ncbi:MAG: ATP-binding protein [Dehalococcoidia bacterium]
MTTDTAYRHTSTESSRFEAVENPPNARRTMQALRELGYDSYSSVLDLVDNSIDGDATTVRITISDHKGDIVIEIWDDGIGMDLETLSEALRIGSDTSRESGDLGKFGMGLVTASIGLSQKVELLTKEQGGALLFGSFDLEEIAAEDRFIKRLGETPANVDDPFAEQHGTVIRLSSTDRISNRHTTTFASTLARRAGQVFRKFLKAGVRIEVNGKDVEAIDPLMLTHVDTRVVLETEVETGSGSNAHLRVVDLPDLGAAGNKAAGIIPENSGFYILRNNREIQDATTFDFYKKHPDYSHFRAELAFDGTLDDLFHTDVKKMTINLSQSFLDRLRQSTQGLITESGRRGRGRANAQRGEVDHSLAESNITRRAPLIPKPPALVEQRAKRAKKGTHTTGNGAKSRSPHITDLKTISGLKVVFDEADYGEQSPFYLVRQDGRTITVSYNREHPFWRELVEHADTPKVIAILDYLVFAMANAELLVPEPAGLVKANVNSTLVGLLV